MLNRILFVLLLCLSVVSEAVGAELKHLAVLEFRGVGLNEQILLNLSDQSRRAATELLAKDEYLILTRETMMEILSDMGKDATCLDGMCELEIGRNIQADIIVTGDIVQYGDTYVLTLKLYTTLSGALLQTVEVQDQNLLALKNKTFSESQVLFQKGLGLSGGSTSSASGNVQSGFVGDNPQSDDWTIKSGGMAIVEFESSPTGAVVLVDGQLLCSTTPCSKSIKEGNHTVVFQKERYFPYESMVNAKTGMTFSGDLKARFGHVSVSSSPSGVNVLIDGETFGSTPINRKEVDAGIHTLSIDDPCYVGQDYRFQMKPRGQEDVTYPVTQRQSAVKVIVRDNEDVLLGDVYFDGRNAGQSSSVIKVPLCIRELQVKVNDRTFTEKLSLQERQISEISVDASDPPVLKGIDYTAKLIQAGTFAMVSECGDDAPCFTGPPHWLQVEYVCNPTERVTISKNFYMMESEVTQALYQRVMGENPSYFKGSNRPVETVSWFAAVEFANKLSSMEGLEQCYTINGNTVTWSNKSCNGWRLPTYAEWEYSARGGQSYMCDNDGFTIDEGVNCACQSHAYAGSDSVGEVAWYYDNSGGETHDVCMKQANGYGLCDMSGNVSEWVWRSYRQNGNTNHSSTSDRSRGGSWGDSAEHVKVSFRLNPGYESSDYGYLGFRLCRTP